MCQQNGTDMDSFIGVSCDGIANSTNFSDVCNYTKVEFVETRACLFGPLGTLICSLGIVGNLILLGVFLRPALKNTYLIYYLALTFIDIGILITVYIVWIVHIVHDYFDSLFVYRFWLSCLPYFYPMSRLFTFSSTYLIVACTIERYLEVLRLRYNRSVIQMNQTRRYVVIAFVVSFCFVLRITSIWEVHVIKNDECAGKVWMEYALDQTDMAKNPTYQRATFWFYNIVQVIIPFVTLLILNTLITGMWFKVDKGRSHSSQSARKMMVAIVTSYLICNALNIFITVWEIVDRENLKMYEQFYVFSVDVVFCLTALNSALRLPIYYVCNHRIRSELKSMLKLMVNMNRSRIEINNGDVVVTSKAVTLASTLEHESGYQPIGNGHQSIAVL